MVGTKLSLLAHVKLSYRIVTPMSRFRRSVCYNSLPPTVAMRLSVRVPGCQKLQMTS